MIKQVLTIIALAHLSLMASAQDAAKLTTKVKDVYSACLQMQKAIGAGSLTELKAANKALREVETSEFRQLRYVAGDIVSLDDHFVFDEEFADSLIAGRDVYRFAQRYADQRTERGSAAKAQVLTKNLAIAAKSSMKYSFVSTGLQELAAVTEPKGAVTLRIHDKTHDVWYNDTDDIKKGRPSRAFSFNLPTDQRSTLEVEIINTTDHPISLIIISN